MGDVIYGHDFKAKAEKDNPTPAFHLASNYSLDYSSLVQTHEDSGMPCDVAYSALDADPA
jgi:hypothetical protein